MCANGIIFYGSETQECHTRFPRAAAPANGVLNKNTTLQNSNFMWMSYFYSCVQAHF
jgi:hypothetical protein